MSGSEFFFSSGMEPGFSGGGGLSFYDLVRIFLGGGGGGSIL